MKIYRQISILLSVLLFAGTIITEVHARTFTLELDGNKKLGDLPHFWSECVGTGTMEYCLKPEWQVAAKIGVKEAGFKYVRGHGIFVHLNNVDNIKVISWKAGSTPTYNWSKIDAIYDAVIACGLEPLVELSFMPPDLQTNTPASKPEDWNVWQNMITEFVTHLEERYGVERVRNWYFEVWNEFDYAGFWKDSKEDYYVLYNKTVAGVRAADSNILVGGPASTTYEATQPLLNYCIANNIKIDFLSNHQYGGPGGDNASANAICTDNRERANVIKNSGRKLLSFNTEFNSTYSGQGGYVSAANCVSMDSHKNAPFVTKVIKLIINDYTSGQYQLPDILSYWAISDCFDESGNNNGNSYIEWANKIPFGQVFGLINYQGVRKATFSAYKMLHMMGTTNLSLTGGSGENDGIDAFATVNKDSTEICILIYNYYENLKSSGANDTAKLQISKLPFPAGQNFSIQHFRIDSTHTNPYQVWVNQGKPVSPSTSQWETIKAQETMAQLELPSTIQYTGSPITKTIVMPRWSVSLLTFKRDATAIRSKSIDSFNGNMLCQLQGKTLVSLKSTKTPLSVSIFAANGQLMRSFPPNEQSVDISTGLPNGMYLILIKSPGMLVSKKMIINR
ncbi:MAG TPA: T9SS type A sorting domain-containing protein [Chitinispirillaceae bacterium]|nr:T9SS type A sorting domain-containing protein [Chitinispirillaceae bacterium]